MVLRFPWEAWDCRWACWYKILCLQVNKPHNLQISIINHFVCAGLPLSSLQTGFSQRCPWELFMCCLNKHNWKESTLSKLHCWLYRAEPTVSYNSPATPMIRSVKVAPSTSCLFGVKCSWKIQEVMQTKLVLPGRGSYCILFWADDQTK